MWFELRRKIMHMLVGTGIVLLTYFNILSKFWLFIILIIGIMFAIISKFTRVPIISWFLDKFERPNAKFPGRGPIYLVAGSLLVLQLFPRDIAFASIMVVTLGDPLAHLVGRFFGRIKNIYTSAHKNIEGMVVGIIIAFLGAWLFVPALQAFLAAAFAMIAEVVEFQLNKANVDDNLLVPLVAGTVIYLLRLYVL